MQRRFSISPGPVAAPVAAAALLASTPSPAPGASTSPAPATAAAPATAPVNVGTAQFAALMRQTNTVLLDVRTPREHAAGSLPGAALIDFNAPDFGSRIAALDKSKTYLVYCAVGGRSAKACEQMARLGFRHVYNLEGGYKAWDRAGQPTAKPTP